MPILCVLKDREREGAMFLTVWLLPDEPLLFLHSASNSKKQHPYITCGCYFVSRVPLSWKCLASTMENKSLPVTETPPERVTVNRGKTTYPWDSLTGQPAPILLSEVVLTGQEKK